ncbi:MULTISPECIES: hypothetical protein [Streptomyces]|uniref:hypothetical protein n=1 Tax=Streptomyces TaxID=1883 RepID=UPI00117EF721|nr:hypothetical protein [Streptomyces sp. b62]WST55636.1 hypothetical protein OG475_23570 [Streptomyces rubiginosohelvolus]
MSSELLTGAAGLLGAALGAAGAVWAGSVTAKSQRQQTRDQLDATQARWKLEQRRDIYLQLLTRASMWQSASWELLNSLSNGLGEEEKAEIHRRKLEHWQEFAATSTVAKVFTTDTDVQAATAQLHDALLALDRISEDGYRQREGGAHDSHTEAFRSKSRECEVATSSLAGKVEAALNLSTAASRSATPHAPE